MAAGAVLLHRPLRLFDLCFLNLRGRRMRMSMVLHLCVRVATVKIVLAMAGHLSPITAVTLILVVMGMRPWLPPFFLRRGTQTRCPSSLEWPRALLMGGWIAAQSGLPGSRDDCCDFDLEVPEPSMLRYDGVAGNRTREPERNQQDPQRAKTDVDNGPLPQERFEKRPTGQRSHLVSSLTPFPSPEWAPLLPSASPSASHGFRSADSALRGVSDCLPSSVAPFGFSPPLLLWVAVGLGCYGLASISCFPLWV